MSSQIRSLIVEDNDDDALLLVEHLRDEGFSTTWHQVQTSAELLDALTEPWDVVFSDFTMPTFNGLEALEIVSRNNPELPFIFVSGTIGEEAAVNAMRMGAKDYIIKNDLVRLVPVLERELKDSELRQKQLRLEQLMRKMTMAVNQAADSVFITDEVGIIEYVNPAFEAMLGYSSSEVLGHTARLFLSQKHSQDIFVKAAETIQAGDVFRGTFVNIHKSGQLVFEDRVISPLKDGADQTTHYVCTGRDITRRLLAEESYKQLADILEVTPDVVFMFDETGQLHYLNSAGRELFCIAYSDGKSELVRQMNFENIFPETVNGFSFSDLVSSLDTCWTGEAQIELEHGRQLPVSLVLLRHEWQQNEQAKYYSAIARDLTPQKELEEQLKHRASYDGLTDLPNRFLLLDRLKQAMARSRRTGDIVAVYFLDMDNFKRVNDTLGHDVGDELLKQVAQRMQQSLREKDTLARHGGDEFTILVDDLNSTEAATSILRKLQSSFDQPIVIDGHEIFVSFCTGIALYPQDAETVEDLLRFADTAMYRAKSKSLGSSDKFCYFMPEMNSFGDEVLSLEADLWRALERKEYTLYFQPQVSLFDESEIGGELLLRWLHPKRGVVSPDEFLPVLEETGLIITVGEWVLWEACTLLQTNVKQRISINISGSQFDDHDFFNKVKQAIIETGIPRGALELEITEQVAMKDPAFAAEVLEGLAALGVSCAIDDFGTGYSSLAYLKNFPIETIKIDRTFVKDLSHNIHDTAIVEASLLMAHKLELKAVAEGVETKQQAQFLKSCSCDFAQGYYFGRPAPIPG